MDPTPCQVANMKTLEWANFIGLFLYAFLRFGMHLVTCYWFFIDRYWCCCLLDTSGWRMTSPSQCGHTQYPTFRFTLIPSRFLIKSPIPFFPILSNHLTDQSLWYILTSDNALNPREWLMGAPGAFAKWVCGSDISIHHTKGTSNIRTSNLAKCLPSTWYHAGEVGECSHTGSDGHWLPCSGLCLILTISSSDSL